MAELPVCSFCDKGHTEVKHLILRGANAPNVAICDECVTLHMEVLATSSNEWRNRLLKALVAVEPVDPKPAAEDSE
jgi:ATP-dependent protease Clp ATPase subunit